jgi:Protein of unknown function (DUF1573)
MSGAANRKPSIVIIGAIAIIAGLAIGARIVTAVASSGGESPPRLKIGTHEQDFGSVQAGVPLDTSFLVTNRGGQRLILHEMNGGCGCMKPGRTAIIVPPGDAATLTSRLETDHLAGPLKLEVRYQTNDPTQTELKLFVLVDVKRQ